MRVKLIYDKPIEGTDYAKSLLKIRGIEEVEKFLEPDESVLNKPYNLGVIIRIAFDMLMEHIKKDSKILLVVDSDMDGFCSAAIMYQFIQENRPTLNIDFICHENKQHGIEDILKRKDINDYDLVILPDAGTNDGRFYAQYPSVDFLVLDHHEPDKELFIESANMYLVNNQISEQYTNKSLCGTGVVWQFLRNFSSSVGKYIDLVGFATVSDMMDLRVLENRYLVDQGLSSVKNHFLKALIEKQSFSLKDGPLTPIKVAFYIAPLINAMCRVGTMAEKNQMFIAFIDGTRKVPCKKRGATGTLEEVAIESARECTNARSRQKNLEEKMTELANMQIINNNLLDNKILVVILDDEFEDIPSEINGLAAAKLVSKYKRPVLVLRRGKDGQLKGSARGLSTIDMPPLKDFLESSNYFEYNSGHQLAHGASISQKNLELLHSWANEKLKDVDFNEGVWEVDFIFDITNIKELPHIIDDLEDYKTTWGQCNPDPIVAVRGIKGNVLNTVIKGATKNTVEISYRDVKYLFFKCTPEEVKNLTSKDIVLDIVGNVSINYYNGRSTPQVIVKDYEIYESFGMDFDF